MAVPTSLFPFPGLKQYGLGAGEATSVLSPQYVDKYFPDKVPSQQREKTDLKIPYITGGVLFCFVCFVFFVLVVVVLLWEN